MRRLAERIAAAAFNDGDRVLVRRRQIDQVSRGDVVVLEPPLGPAGRILPGPPRADGRHWNIKRAAALPGAPVPQGIDADGDRVPAGALVVYGDNSDSVDSRQRGFFEAARLLGVALRRLGGSTL
ncbi:S26 family signal peptidase [Nonomuraea turcica]|uniref:S26 family signal peptidase n=1 Tax=Nonomuraea sp. G32 TaxID=3067274 RepID=UPI00273BBF79|nr:S26 family signal peptidase [Nonomuraea sp. G32]MDP4501365.1 S26 family signal peptidase [Nonomuraea sp. G32]